MLQHVYGAVVSLCASVCACDVDKREMLQQQNYVSKGKSRMSRKKFIIFELAPSIYENESQVHAMGVLIFGLSLAYIREKSEKKSDGLCYST